MAPKSGRRFRCSCWLGHVADDGAGFLRVVLTRGLIIDWVFWPITLGVVLTFSASFSDFVGNHGETAPGFAGRAASMAAFKGEQVGLVGNVVDQRDDFVDFIELVWSSPTVVAKCSIWALAECMVSATVCIWSRALGEVEIVVGGGSMASALRGRFGHRLIDPVARRKTADSSCFFTALPVSWTRWFMRAASAAMLTLFSQAWTMSPRPAEEAIQVGRNAPGSCRCRWIRSLGQVRVAVGNGQYPDRSYPGGVAAKSP